LVQEAVSSVYPSGPGTRSMAPPKPKIIRAAEIVDDPDLVAPLPYLNFLRYLKRKFFRSYDLRRLLQVGLVHWNTLSDAKKRLFEPEVRQ